MAKFFKKSFKNKDKKKRIRKSYIILCMIFLVIIILGLIDIYRNTYYKNTRVEYNTFQESLDKEEINVVYLYGNKIYYVLHTDNSRDMSPEDRLKISKKQKDRYEVEYPNYENFRKDVISKGALIDFYHKSSLLESSFSLAMLILMPTMLGFLMFFTFKQLNMSKKTDLVTSTTDNKVKFEDILGLDEILDDIKFTLSVLTNPELCKEYNLKPPRGLLLSGPPGTGKTMIAKAIANELGVNILSVDSSSLVEMFAGLGASRVRGIFKRAKLKKPCVIFFDELDAIGEKRNNSSGDSVNREYKQILDALLQELDGFSSEDGVFVIGATNLESSLDSALTRSGRFSKKIVINPPKNADAREQLFKLYLKGINVEHVDLDILARQTVGLTGADIADICNEGKMIAVAKQAEYMTTDILEEALDRKLFKGSRTKSEHQKDREITAYHESGHAISMLLNNLEISRITIIPNTSGTGGMVVNKANDSSFYTKEYIRARIKAAYAGRAAEELVYGQAGITTGASSDIQVATDLIRGYIEKFGFDSEVGLLDIKGMMRDGYINNQLILEKIHNLSKELYQEARFELNKHRDLLDIFSAELLDKETISGDYAVELFKRNMGKNLKENEE